MTNETITIYHNPACSKSRETLDILDQHHMHPKVIEYLVTPPTKSEITSIINKLGIAPAALLRTTEASFVNAGYDIDAMSDDEIIDALVKHPVLLQRPIIISGDRAVIGRPPVKVLDIIPSQTV